MSEHSSVDRDATTSTSTEVAVMIVGTPRSGTTLVQRTVSESCGLPTVPETHMFTVFAPRLLRKTKLPLANDELRSALDSYVSLKQHRGGAPTAAALYERLGGRADSMAELFVAVVTELSDGAPKVAEKTPDHMLWIEHLASALPSTKFITVVRDPRAVYASTSQVHWGQQNAVMAAERWASDQRMLAKIRRRLPADRLLLLRYEDLVTDEAETVAAIRGFVGPSSSDSSAPTNRSKDASDVFRPHEMEWKRRAAEPVTAERLEVWKETLSPEIVGKIEAVCGAEMREAGYDPVTSPAARLSIGDRADQARYRVRRTAHELRIRHSYAPRAGLR